MIQTLALLLQLITIYFCITHAFQSSNDLINRMTLKFTPRDELTFDEPNDFDLSMRLTSHQSSSSPASSSASTQQYKPDENRKNLVVWIIDDEQPILDALGSYLTSSGYQVHSFLSATVPLSLLQTQAPDAIISDVMMPQTSGIEFLTILRSSNPSTRNIPFILLTAKSMTEDRIRGYDAGTDGYLMKPFDPEELVVMLDQIVQRREFMQMDDSVSVEELRQDLSEVKELLSKEERLLAESKQEKGESTALLSDDELEILELLCQGYMNKEIAAELQYSISTVEKHLTTLFRKTNCSNRTELVRWAVANEYVDI